MVRDPKPHRRKRPPKDRPDLTREQAKAYRDEMHRQAADRGVSIDDYRLTLGRDNDVFPEGSGPRFNIVAFSQQRASEGALYRDVIGQEVQKGDGGTYRIRERDLLGYVCANGYCRLIPPEW